MASFLTFPTNYTLRARIIKLQFLLFDLGVSALALYVGLLIGELIGFLDGFGAFVPAFVVLLFLRFVTAFSFKTYLVIIRYIGERDIRSAFLAITTSTFFFFVFLELTNVVPYNKILIVVMIELLLSLIVIIGLRVALRYAYDKFKLQRGSRLNLAIFGAGELGATTARVLRQQSAHNYRLVAYFDDNPTIHHKFLNGVKIFNPLKSFVEVIRKNDIKVVIIAIDELAESRRVEFINQCLALKLKVLKVPQAEDWLNNNLNIGQIRNINFEDLLNRSPIQLDEAIIKETITDKVILVTGCAGSIGSEIVRQLMNYYPKMIIGLDQAETPLAELTLSLQQSAKSEMFKPIIGDVKDYNKLLQVFERYRPEYVFHAAAYKHVPIMEEFPEEAILANVLGTRHVADAASLYAVEKFVMVSTDKAVNPSNVMGASKRIAEIYVQALNFRKNNRTQFITTRFGNVLGSNGSVIPIFQRQIEQRQPITVTHPDITRFFMTIPEACQLVLEAGAMGNGGEIFVFDMGAPVRIADLAEKMIQMAGLTPGRDINIVFTGLRPGEKLYEELLAEQEGIIPTHHPKIKKAAVRVYDYVEADQQVENLCQLAQTGSTSKELVALMKTIVPEFVSQNSVYSDLALGN